MKSKGLSINIKKLKIYITLSANGVVGKKAIVMLYLLPKSLPSDFKEGDTIEVFLIKNHSEQCPTVIASPQNPIHKKKEFINHSEAFKKAKTLKIRMQELIKITMKAFHF